MEIIIIGLLAVAAVLGLIIGFGKGFTRVNAWGIELLLAAVIVLALGQAVLPNGEGIMPGLLMFGLAVIVLIILKLITLLIRGALRGAKKRKMARQRDGGDEVDEIDEVIDDDDDDGMNDDMDEDEYEDYAEPEKKKKGKRKIYNDEIRGACGIFDRIIGSVALAIKGVMIVGIILAVLLVAVDLLPGVQADGSDSVFGGIKDAMSDIYAGTLWTSVKPLIMDFLVLAMLFLCVKSGFANGFSQTLWSVLVIGMFVGAGFLAWYLSFNVQPFVDVAENIAVKLGDVEFIKSLSEFMPVFSAINIAKCILTVLLFILLAIFVFILKAFVPGIIFWARKSDIVYFVDGVFGALFATGVLFAVLLAVGFVLNPISDIPALAPLTAYFENSKLANYLYTDNVLVTIDFLPDLRTAIRDWAVSK